MNNYKIVKIDHDNLRANLDELIQSTLIEKNKLFTKDNNFKQSIECFLELFVETRLATNELELSILKAEEKIFKMKKYAGSEIDKEIEINRVREAKKYTGMLFDINQSAKELLTVAQSMFVSNKEVFITEAIKDISMELNSINEGIETIGEGVWDLCKRGIDTYEAN